MAILIENSISLRSKPRNTNKFEQSINTITNHLDISNIPDTEGVEKTELLQNALPDSKSYPYDQA